VKKTIPNVILVLLTDPTHHNVNVTKDGIMLKVQKMVKKLKFVKLVLTNVLNVSKKMIIVLLVPLTELLYQNVSVLILTSMMVNLPLVNHVHLLVVNVPMLKPVLVVTINSSYTKINVLPHVQKVIGLIKILINVILVIMTVKLVPVVKTLNVILVMLLNS